jgi:4'-phosphopantetheinyl transferase
LSSLLDNVRTESKSTGDVQYPPDNSCELITLSVSDLRNTNLKLSTNDIHVWHAKLEDPLVSPLEGYLSQDEHIRAHRFRFKKDRNHFIIARGLLRTILASYLDTEPSDVQFSYADKGKPALKITSGNKTVNFNLAHSHGRALYAFSRNRELGVDLEFIRDELADEAVAERFFSQAEVAALRSLPPEIRREAFYNCWTRKEAYIKARGEGLSMPLNEFDVSLVPGLAAALLRNHKDPNETSRWSMQSLPAEPGYVAALVAEGHDWQRKNFYLRAIF